MKRRVLLLGFLAACSKAPTDAECDQLLTHVVELEVAAAGGAAGATPEAKAALETQRKKVAESVGKDFLSTCRADLPRAQVRCGLAATTLDGLAACDDT